MADLFRIETDTVLLTWSSARGARADGYSDSAAPPGRLVITPLRPGLTFGAEPWREDVPAAVARNWNEEAGPRLFEQTDYTLFLESRNGQPVRLEARDATLLRDLEASPSKTVTHGVINFGQQVGLSDFTVRVGDVPEFSFQVEVFPTKLDYATDYEELVASVQEILTGLVLEYLRATFRLGQPDTVTGQTRLEWTRLLRHLLSDLERAVNQIARSPRWLLQRDPQPVRPERVKRVDASVRKAMMRTTLRPTRTESPSRIVERRPIPTLDTPEHRWLATQLRQVRRGLARLHRAEATRQAGQRTPTILSELEEMEQRIARLAQLPPFAAATGPAPANFASVQLVSAPGYREAYRCCLILLLGIRLSGGPVSTSLKDISELYEYWCFLAVVRMIADDIQQPIPVKDLFKVEELGVRVQLRKGTEQRLAFRATSGRRILVSYNPQFQGQDYLLPQRPDIVITLEDPGWPPIRLVIDAKYRLDTSPAYIERYGMRGPPEDAINVLHRYRDAIIDLDPATADSRRPKHSVVQAAALFPYRDSAKYRSSRLWSALERIGVGAIPLLPGAEEHVADWLRARLQEGGWALSDRAISHAAWDRARGWRAAAAEPVLVGTLRGGAEQEHLEWVLHTRTYYMRQVSTQPRQYATRWVALYVPRRIRDSAGVAFYAPVEEISVLPRRDISTPWRSHRDPDEQQIVFRLGEVTELKRPIAGHEPGVPAPRFSSHRWTSRLALERASKLEELFLETEPEWRLLEALRAHGLPFRLDVDRPRLQSEEDPAGRAWFVVGVDRVQYQGAAGFAFRRSTGRVTYIATVDGAVKALEVEDGTSESAGVKV